MDKQKKQHSAQQWDPRSVSRLRLLCISWEERREWAELEFSYMEELEESKKSQQIKYLNFSTLPTRLLRWGSNFIAV